MSISEQMNLALKAALQTLDEVTLRANNQAAIRAQNEVPLRILDGDEHFQKEVLEVARQVGEAIELYENNHK